MEQSLSKIIKLKSTTRKSKENIYKLELLAEQIFKKLPFLYDILKENGNRSLLEYTQDAQLYQPLELYKQRRIEFLDVANRKIEDFFGKKIAEESMLNISNQYYLPTSDHLGPYCHPFFNDSNLVNAFASSKNNKSEKNKLYLLNFASSSISLNNSSYPRGILFHAKDSMNRISEHKLPLQSKNKLMTPIYSFTSYKEKGIELVKAKLLNKKNKGEINNFVSKSILAILNSIYSKNEVLALQSYSKQITKTTYYLWQKLFSKKELPTIENIYLDLEDFIKTLLIDYHFESNSPINKLLFDKNVRSYGLDIFDDMVGSHSSKNNKGTVFFWGVVNQQRKRLVIDNENLVSSDLSIQISLTPNSIKDALEEGLLIPNLLLTFLLLSGYYGISCFGGISQVNYLTVMMKRWRVFLKKLNLKKEAELSKSIPTKILYGDMSISFLTSGLNNSQIVPTSFIDLVIYKQQNILSDLMYSAGKVKLTQSILLNFPEFYRILYDVKKRKQELLTLTHVDVMSMFKQEDKNNFFTLKI